MTDSKVSCYTWYMTTQTDYSQEIGPREPGSVTWDGYWRQWDLTLSVETDPADWMPWAVTVVTCDEHGFPIPGEPERRHCTAWDAKRDKVRDPIR